MKTKKNEQEDNNGYTLVVNYPSLCAGGIEKKLANLMQYSLAKGYRVIWVTNHYYVQRVAFDGILGNENLEIIFHERFNKLLKVPHIHFDEDEHVIMITCRAMQYIVSEEIKRKAIVKEFKHFFTVAHYTGNAYYPDRWIKFGHNTVYGYYQKIVQRLIDNDCLRAFSLKHLESYEEYYNVQIENKKEKVLPLFMSADDFDLDNSYIRCNERNKKFVITTCARFEFPHKGYILGLIDAFVEIKKKHIQTVLQIAGYGSGECELKEKINKLPENIKKDIVLLGMISQEELYKYYRKSHLAVGLAGAINDAARSGVPSLVVRHYCCNCETYGYYDKAFDKTLSEEQGENIIPFIESCINMNDKEYLACAQNGYKAVQAKFKTNPAYFYEQYEAKSDITVMYPRETLIGRLIYIYTEVKERILFRICKL